MERTATHSSDYVQRYADKKPLTREQKRQKLAKIWNSDPSSRKSAAITRIGQAMVGPIQIKLRYEGFVRNVLVEDTLEKGPLQPYDVIDDLGQAYILNATEAEVKETPFEGKQVYPTLFRIASFPFVRKEDLFLLRANIIEHAQDETRQAIMKQEDGRLLTLLSTAITDYASEATHVVTPDHIVEIGAGNPLDVVDFYDLISRIELHEIEASQLLMNPADVRDLYTWDVNTTGWAFKDRVFGGEQVTEFGEFTIRKSIMVPQGTVFIVPAPNFLGVMPVMYSLDVEENNQVEQFHRGWVMDELISMLILNPRGLGAIKKV
jgi:hypothetical protein